MTEPLLPASSTESHDAEEDSRRARRASLLHTGPAADGSGPPPWLLTFADLMSQLLGLFIMLLTFSHLDPGRIQGLKGSLQSTFGSGHPASGEPSAPPVVSAPPEDGRSAQHRGVLEGLHDLVQRFNGRFKGGLVDVELFETYRGVTLRLGDSAIFDVGEDAVRPGAWPFLDGIAELVALQGARLEIEAYVAPAPEQRLEAEDAGRFAGRRAISVARYLVGRRDDLSPTKVSARAMGAAPEVGVAASGPTRKRGNRVDFVLVADAALPEPPP